MDINKIYQDLLNELKKGIARDPNRKILAIETGIDPITLAEWKKVSVGKKVITGAYAGTNWITALVEKGTNGLPIYKELSKTVITSDKHNITIDDFVELMAQNVLFATKNLDLSNIDTVAIALGFSQRNQKTPYGVEAQFNVKYPGKTWNILDFDESKTPEDQPFLGKILLEKLGNFGLKNFKYVFFENDTNAVSNYINDLTTDNSLGVGFVFGTGDNAALGSINFELGRLDLIEADEIYNALVKEKIFTDSFKKFEHWMGGHYIKRRLAMDMKLQGETEVFDLIMANHDGTILSDIAAGLYNNQILGKAETSAQRILTETGQLIGITLAAVATTGLYNPNLPAILPVEGSVFWKGYKVREIAQDTLNSLIPNNKLQIVQAAGIIGIGQAACIYPNLLLQF